MHKYLTFTTQVAKTDSFKSAIKQIAFALSLLLIITLTRNYLEHPVLSIGLQLILWYIVLSVSFAVIRSLMLTSYRMKHKLEYDHYDNYTAAVINILNMVKIIASFAIILHVFNVEIQEFVTSISIFAVALVLIFKEHITNLINGVILLFSPIYQIGNYIEIDETRGRIVDINLINITILDEKNQRIHIPNSVLLTKTVTNISRSKEKIIMVTVVQPRDKSYLDFRKKFNRRIKVLLEKHTGIKTIHYDIDAIDKDTYTLTISISVKSYTLAKEREIRALINKTVLK